MSRGWDGCLGDGGRAQWLRQQAREAAAAKARAEAARQAELRSLMPSAERGDVAAMRRIAALLADGCGYIIDYRSAAELSARGVGAYFVWPRGPIVAPPITDLESFATFLHEYGHGVAGVCPGREPHRPDPSVRDWTHCIQCETDAWKAATEAVPFTLEMFRNLQWSLRIYRGMTPASAAAIGALDTLASFEKSFAEPRQRKVETQLRQELVTQWQRESREARERDYQQQLARLRRA
jgi:hypothetical protein